MLAFHTGHDQTVVALADEFGDELDLAALGSDYLPMVNAVRRRLGLLPLVTIKPAPPALALPPVSLHAHEVSLAAVADVLDEQIGGKGLLVVRSPSALPTTTFSFDGDRVALVDILAKMAELDFFGIVPQDANPAVLALDDSGLRVLASKAADNALLLVHPMVKDPKFQNRPALRLTVAIDPRLPVVARLATLPEAVDEDNHYLRIDDLQWKTQCQNTFGLRFRMDPPMWAQVVLHPLSQIHHPGLRFFHHH